MSFRAKEAKKSEAYGLKPKQIFKDLFWSLKSDRGRLAQWKVGLWSIFSIPKNFSLYVAEIYWQHC